MRTPDLPHLDRAFLAFLIVGGVAAMSQWLSRFAFGMIMPYPAAIGASYLVGMIIAFELNRRFVFPDAADKGRQRFLRFALVNAASFAMVWTVSILLGQWLLPKVMDGPTARAAGHMVGILSPVMLSYMLHKHYTFRASPPDEHGLSR